MRWRRATFYAALLLAWSLLALWQWHEVADQCAAARDDVRAQAQSLMQTLTGSIRSHRRLGPFFQTQFQQTLDNLVDTQSIVAALVVLDDADAQMAAGRHEQLDRSANTPIGDFWEPGGFRLVVAFEVHADEAGGGPGGGPGFGPGGGGGRGMGPGGGRGLGAAQGPFSTGGRFVATLMLDRSACDSRCRRAAALGAVLVVCGGIVLACVAVVWEGSLRLMAVAARTRVLQAESKHVQELSQAAAGLAHETRNPLGLIRGWSQRLGESLELPPDGQRHLRAITEECDRVVARLNQFLAFARPRDPQLQSTNLSGMLEELTVLLEPDLDDRKLQLQTTLEPADLSVDADPEMLRQALFNLLQNAMQHAPAGSVVEVTARVGEKRQVRIEVADRGPGVPAEEVASLFTPYFTTRPDGTGLGLAIVRRIATMHRWECGYADRASGGAVFYLDRIR